MGNVKEKLNAEERAYRLLTETIKQSYKPGDFILESSLAIDFGMSRTPISIALNRLVSEGILKNVYDLENDPDELKNLANTIDFKEIKDLLGCANKRHIQLSNNYTDWLKRDVSKLE